MKRIAGILLCLLLLGGVLSAGEARASTPDGLIATAFRMLEEDNPFVRRFEERSGQKVDIMFPLGMPYLFGNPYSRFAAFDTYPDYRIWVAPKTSGYFVEGGLYFYGTDCTGFINYINKENNRPMEVVKKSLRKLLTTWENKHAYHLYNNESDMPPQDRLKDTLQVGDYLILHHDGARYSHITMYIGTMRDFGYAAEEEPELAAYLDYPLVVHCGLSPVYGERFQRLIDEYPEKYGRLTTTDGGVQVSIVGVDDKNVPVHRHVQNTDYGYFIMNDGGYCLTNITLSEKDLFCWMRQPDTY